MTTPASQAALIQDLVDANRILYYQGVVDAFGHVSARSGKHRKASNRKLAARLRHECSFHG